MDILSTEQSALLNRLSESSQKYSVLSDAEKVICHHLLDLGYANKKTISKSSSANGFFQSWTEIDTVSISEAGKMYLINEKLTTDQYIFLKDQMQSLRDLADTAIMDSQSARKDALFSKVISIIAIAISVIAIIIPILL